MTSDYHRRTLEETCQVCKARPGARCIDQRITRDTPTKNLHRYKPELETAR